MWKQDLDLDFNRIYLHLYFSQCALIWKQIWQKRDINSRLFEFMLINLCAHHLFSLRWYDYYYYLTTWAEQIRWLSLSTLLANFVGEIGKQNLTELIFRISFWNVTHMLWASYKWFDGKYSPAKVANRLMWWKEQGKRENPRRKVKKQRKRWKRNWNERIRKRKERVEFSRNKWTTRNEKCIPTCFHIQYRFIIQFHK